MQERSELLFENQMKPRLFENHDYTHLRLGNPGQDRNQNAKHHRRVWKYDRSFREEGLDVVEQITY